GGMLAGGVGGQAGQRQFLPGQVFGVVTRQAGVFDQRQRDVLLQVERGEQGAPLEQHTETPLDFRAAPGRQLQQVFAEHPHAARIGPAQADDAAQQHGLARARAAHHAENLAATDIQVEVFMHALAAEAVGQATDFDHRIGRIHQPISMKNSAAIASSRITTKIDCTTLEVVCSPTDCALPLALKPSRQPITAIRKANSGALPRPTRKWFSEMSRCRMVKNNAGEISSASAQTTSPPTMPQSMPTKVSTGRVNSIASTRGSTSSSTGFRPRARIASISSLAFIAPICAAKALAVRPASRIAASSTPNSRRKAKATRLTV